jgi:phosphoribosylformylglycinamidine synthase
MIEKEAFQKKLRHYRLSEVEYHKICELLQREPRPIEWPLFSALWSEHCSYKSSRMHLKKFGQTLNQTVLNASGENAGVVDLGLGERIVFKMESHNHPSFIEPFQGAATGVGGILRDIFTMGARPIALANYLCFGELEANRMKELIQGVVSGISSYGNCVGVPTVTGQTEFLKEYNQNILVNAMAVGLLREGEPVALSQAKGVGNDVVYVGAKTGKDGVHGAAMASTSFDESSGQQNKPNVQIGDPYFEKLLIESCLEVIQKNLVIAIQDMGAAGLTSSSFEMASKGQLGLDFHLDLVPLRDFSMTPEDILLSESQERMLLVCEPEKFSEIEKIFSKWGLDAVRVGKVRSEKQIRLFWKQEVLTEIDPDLLVENAPIYDRAYEKWNSPKKISELAKIENQKEPITEQVLKYLGSVKGGSRKPIYRQYDQRVGLRTCRDANFDVAVLRLPDSGRGLMMATGCRPSLMKIDARLGALDAIFHPALQMAAKGGKALAVTDCLNFANPEKKEIMSEFVASVEALKEASLILQTPIVSGNVSFYNETQGQGIISTPATGVVGLCSSLENLPSDTFQKENETIFSLRWQGPVFESLHFAGDFDLNEAAEFVDLVRELSLKASATQMIGQGGLAVGLSKMCLDGMGCEIDVHLSRDRWLREAMYEVLFSVSDAAAFEKAFQKAKANRKIEIARLGKTKKDTFQISGESALSIQKIAKIYNYAFQEVFHVP